ncbi:PAS domain-containing protein [Herbaspirillum sp. AP02]|uniref:sensor histidine kinase n=1 Tax=unclassified Herbaspirillum TaxID=2624150 RepID=UPI0015DAB749|nr:MULTISPECIES: ATP-binding protein [unclassified Herbaspirillum]MBG7620158.1 PAS domain-containing protein [Herbaspirillum sp. AP02]NZD69410.1 PAS domain-containing protein [Herbaspirillum sp. AP21]
MPSAPSSAEDNDALLQALRNLSAIVDPDRLKAAITHTLCLLAGARRCLLVRQQGGVPVIEAETRRADDPGEDALRDRVATAVELAGAALSLSLLHQGVQQGWLYLYYETTPAQHQAHLAGQLAAHAAVALANANAHAQLLQENEQLLCIEQELRTSRELLKQGERFNHTGSMRYLVREDLMFCSDELCRIYGLEPGRNCITYDEFAAIMHPDDRQEVIDTVNAAVAMGGTIRVEHRICRQDTGEVRYLSGIGKPVWLEGTFIEYVGTATDITVRRQAEYAIRAAQIDMERVSRANTVGQLTASIAHEINQPLMSIVSNAGASLRWLNRAAPELEHARAGLRDIISEGQRAAGIISGLRDLTRNAEPSFTRVNLPALIRHILMISRSELERREVSLSLALNPADVYVLGDQVQLQQVLLNLVVNALDAMDALPEKMPKKVRTLSISASCCDEQRVEVRVQDSGEGIAPEAMSRIFDAFYTTKENGMGMGLAICRSIIESHRGRLRVAAAPSGGSIFSFDLPRVP